MGRTKKYWEGKHFAFYTNKECEYTPATRCRRDGVQLPVLLLPALYAGAEVRGNFTIGKRRQGLQRVPGTPPPENYGFIADSFQKIAGEMAEREKKEGQ